MERSDLARGMGTQDCPAPIGQVVPQDRAAKSPCADSESVRLRNAGLWVQPPPRYGRISLLANHLRPMQLTKRFSTTGANEMDYVVTSKVVTGECATESEGIRGALRGRMARDRAPKGSPLNVIATAYDTLKAGPSNVVAACKVRALRAALHKQTTT